MRVPPPLPTRSRRQPHGSRLRALAAVLAAPALLGGCDWVVMNPSGDVARQQADLVLWSTFLMLLIIVPVIVLTVLFAWKYRAGNDDAEYAPDWDHSTGLELVIWSAPLLIIIALGALTWISTHTLDPYRPLSRTAPGKPLAKNDRPLEIQVVSLDWKWLFIYPEQGIATVNELVLPVDRQVRFSMTSSSVMNAFYIPALAGMVYTMPGMETKLHAVLNRPGRFEGISANYSGAGFSDMRFTVDGTDAAGFQRWVSEAKTAGRTLDNAGYLQLQKPSERVPAMRFAGVQQGLFGRVVGMCVEAGTTCMQDTMNHDMKAGGGHGAAVNDTPDQRGSGAKGAILKEPEEKGSSPHRNAPRGQAPGTNQRGSEANRNMTSVDPLPLPAPVAGRAAVARS